MVCRNINNTFRKKKGQGNQAICTTLANPMNNCLCLKNPFALFKDYAITLPSIILILHSVNFV